VQEDTKTRSRAWNPLTLAVLASVWIAVFGNWPLWRALGMLPEMDSPRGWLFRLAFGGMVAAATAAVLALFAWRLTVKPAITLFLVVGAVAAYFMGSYGVVMDPTMMINVIQTDPGEASDLMSWQLLASVLLLAAIPAIWFWRVPIKPRRLRRQFRWNLLGVAGGLAVGLALVFAMSADFASTMRNHRSLRYLINPLSTFYSLVKVTKTHAAAPKTPPVAIGLDARVAARAPSSRPPLLLLVVGETARADHFSLNGYARDTNRELEKLGVASFVATSCGTSTAASVPCMFSHLGRDAFESKSEDHENLLDVLQRAGLAVLWLDNQSGCKGVCARVPTARTDVPPPGMPLPDSLCKNGECLDEALLYGLDARLAALPAERRAKGIVLVMHQMGSHGPAYWARSPADRKPFGPECTNNALQECDTAAIVNAYDNSIAYSDYFLAKAVAWLGKQESKFDPALLYVSDHGESLGENHLYLHGLPYAMAPDVQKRVPMIVWLARQTEARTGTTMACLREQRDASLSHDNLFHTVLGMAGVQATEYRADLDLMTACQGSMMARHAAGSATSGTRAHEVRLRKAGLPARRVRRSGGESAIETEYRADS
jgi:lipid A ethanolaminephosphotransferase